MANDIYYYIAASFPRKQEAIDLVAKIYDMQRNDASSSRLRACSRWLYLENGYKKMTAAIGREAAIIDIEDVRRADFVICLIGDIATKGGRHSEVGAALALGKRVFLVGQTAEQVFHHHPLCERVTERTLIRKLRCLL